MTFPLAPAAGGAGGRCAGSAPGPAAGVRGYLPCTAVSRPTRHGQRKHVSAQRLRRLPGPRAGQGRPGPLRAPLADGRDLDALQDALWQLRVYLPAALGAKRRDAIRFLPGMHWQEFSETSRQDFAGAEFRISPQSDRMGYRLLGPALSMSQPRQMLSEAACFGTVQVPSGGEAIILMADRQTTGGYPKIAQIATVDLPILAQCAPGQTLRFQPVGLVEAQRLDSERERAFSQLQDALEPLRALLA